MNVLYMAAHYPFIRNDHIPPYPEPEVFRVDMEHADFHSPKSQQHVHLSAPQYTSSPSMDSQADDEERFFDVDVDFPQLQSAQQQLFYDHMPSPPWASSIATPRAWVGEATKVPALEPDSQTPSFPYPQGGGVADSANSSMPTYNLSEYLENPSPVHSPPASYLSPGSTSMTTSMLSPSYYAVSNSDSHPHNSPYTLASRYNPSLQSHDPGCDPRFVSSSGSGSPHTGSSSSNSNQDIGISFSDVYTDPSQGIKVEQDQQSIDIGPLNVLHQQHHMPFYESDSGEDEKSESESDPSYMPSSSRFRPMSLPSASRMRPRHMRSSSAGSSVTIGLDGDPLRSQRPTRTPAPEPVPNLTKKSRGRRVPTATALYGTHGSGSGSSSGLVLNSSGKNARTYVCKVKECGKCFARSEHLKRHVRSIHTNEKPHRCPHSGCNKEFSRHDNLCQHMRVHRNFSAPKDGAFGSF